MVAKLKSQYNTLNYRIIENPALKTFSLPAKCYMIISTKMTPTPCIKTPVLEISKL